jgi:hypothetical protein
MFDEEFIKYMEEVNSLNPDGGPWTEDLARKYSEILARHGIYPPKKKGKKRNPDDAPRDDGKPAA